MFCPTRNSISHSFNLKMIVRLPGFFCPKMFVRKSARLEIEGSKLNNVAPNLLYQEIFWHRDFRGRFIVVVVFYFWSHTYNYSVNGQRASISPQVRNHFGTEGVQVYSEKLVKVQQGATHVKLYKKDSRWMIPREELRVELSGPFDIEGSNIE